MKATPHYGYVQLSNMFWRSAKTFTLLRNNPAALGYLAVLLSWSGDNLSDGFIPSNVMSGLFAVPDDALKALLTVGFLEEAKDGYQIHDYLDWNRSKSQIEEEAEKKREQARLRKQKQRASSDKKRDESVNVTHMSRTCHAPVTPLSRTTTELQNNITTEQHFSFSPTSSSRSAANNYQPDEKKKKEMEETYKISEAQLVKLLAGFHEYWDSKDELKSHSQWEHLFDGWIAMNKDRLKYQVHKHTWACEHTLHALGVESTAELTSAYGQAGNLTYGNQLAQKVARLLNDGVSEQEAVSRARALMPDGSDADSFRSHVDHLEASEPVNQTTIQAGGLKSLYAAVDQLVGA